MDYPASQDALAAESTTPLLAIFRRRLRTLARSMPRSQSNAPVKNGGRACFLVSRVLGRLESLVRCATADAFGLPVRNPTAPLH
jgi:hypothetical protein